MKNSGQTKIALLCVALMSKSLFASDVGAVKFGSSILSPKPIAIPSFGSTPGSSGANPRPAFEVGGSSPLKVKKISGTFGSPLSELMKNNVSNAKAACIQEAASAGERLPEFNDSSVWEFATTSSQSPIESMITPVQKGVLNTLEGDSSAPPAFAKGCASDLQGEACSALLGKSMNEVTQAYYNSSLKSGTSDWDEVLSYLGLMPIDQKPGEHIDIVTALQKKMEKENPSEEASTLNSFRTIENQDPLLLATKLIIQRLDEALARGDREGADRAKAILKKVNPSAAYAATCVLGNAKNGGLNDQLDPAGRPQGSYFGPLSGVDYSKQDDMIKHGNLALIGFVVGTALSVAGLVMAWAGNKSNDEKEARAAAAQAKSDAIAMQAAKETRNLATLISLQSYKACNGDTECQSLYPLAKEALANAKKEGAKSASGTAGPEHPVEEGKIEMKPIIITAPKPGSGGSGGELVPFEDRPVKIDMSDKLSAQKESWKRADPMAADNFCQKTLSDFKAFGFKRLTGSGRPVVTMPSQASAPIPTKAFGVAEFDKWTPSYWAEQKKIHLSDPANKAKENNCQAMDEVEGL
ncbi:MAG: hypothetical protein EOP06_01045 [Proteobacteria bacterium]|nr:MAG: hypothetical protein EOP06_01045 [Pseudomonadota bacterium]